MIKDTTDIKMKSEKKYSVLMSVYAGEKAEYLHMSMDSMWHQTVPTDNFVLVCDGPLNDELDAVIDFMEREHPDFLYIVRLEKNGGLGNALNIGMKYCKNELVARMDSDDISRPDRCEKQLMVFQEHPNITICSGIIEEFTESIYQVEARRVLPETNDEIMKFAKKRNPFNHPCVMFKKSAVEASGGYQDFYLLEDYYLWIRMLQKGCVCYNLQQPLLWMRAGSDLYKRRAGWKYLKSRLDLFKYMKTVGFIDEKEYIKNMTIIGTITILPNRIRHLIYTHFLRNKK